MRSDLLRPPGPLLLALALVAAIAWAPAPAEAGAPSFVVFLADDLGFSDLSSYGGEIPTPAIDGIGERGVRFRQFYATPRCSPTRASLLTGLHPHAAGMGHLADLPADDPAYAGRLRADVATVPERLRAAGYRTYMVGKWHLDSTNDPAGPAAPLARGFDRFYGVMRGAEDFYRPRSLARDDRPLPEPDGDFYLTDRLADEAVSMLRDHAERRPEAPFFLYVAFTAPHWPVQAPAPDIEAARGIYARGWDDARARRSERLRRLDVLPGAWTPAPRDPQVPPWTEAEQPDWQRARMRAYAGMLRNMDRAVGRILEALGESGRDGDTVVFFLSDNGGSPEALSPASGWLRRAAGLFTWEHYGDDPSREPGGPDSFQSYGRAWSNVSNAPFRGHKAGLYEGGIASPLLVDGPGARDRGGDRWIDAPAHVTDVAATILDRAGIQTTTTLDGESLRPLIEGDDRPRGPIFWEHEGWRAVRAGDWKAVAASGAEWELYDLGADRTEQRNLAHASPAELARLVSLHGAWAEDVGVRSWPWVLPLVRRLAAGLGLGVLGLAVIARIGWIRRARRRPASEHGIG